MRVSRTSLHHLTDWVYTHMTNVDNHQNADDIHADCPFCESRVGRMDTKQHLYISKRKAVAHCFRCDWKGSWITLVVSVDGCSYDEARELLSGKHRLEEFYTTPDEPEEISSVKEHAEFPEGFMLLTADDDDMVAKAVRTYLQRRSIKFNHIHCGMFGYVSGKLRAYLLPSDDYWQARAILKIDEPKYLNPAAPFSGLGLWDSPGIREEVRKLQGAVYIVEGVFSAYAVFQRGYPAAALIRKTATETQLRRLIELRRPLNIMMDADAHENSWNLAFELVNKGVDQVNVCLLKAGDPADGFEHISYPVSSLDRACYELNSLLER